MSKIIVLGASGYVGINFLSQLCRETPWQIIALVHSAGGESKIRSLNLPVDIVRFNNGEVPTILSNLRDVHGIVNLAYANRGNAFSAYNNTINITKFLSQLATNIQPKHLIHVSTQAVFGYDPKSSPNPVKHTQKYGDSYIVSKSISEKVIEDLAKRNPDVLCSIIRLGNIIGPGSPPWTYRILNRLRDGEPLGYIGSEGYSNATYVTNISEYLVYLMKQDAEVLRTFGLYHHLAEFSHIHWKEWVQDLAILLGYTPQYIEKEFISKSGYYQDLKSIFKKMFPAMAKGLTSSDHWGPRLLKIVNKLNLTETLKSYKSMLIGNLRPSIDETLLGIFSTNIEFKTNALGSWRPSINHELAKSQIKRWIISAGFTHCNKTYP